MVKVFGALLQRTDTEAKHLRCPDDTYSFVVKAIFLIFEILFSNFTKLHITSLFQFRIQLNLFYSADQGWSFLSID